MAKYDAGWYTTIFDNSRDSRRGLDGLYHLTTCGCGCCCSFDILAKEEYLILLNELKDLVDEEIEKVKKDG